MPLLDWCRKDGASVDIDEELVVKKSASALLHSACLFSWSQFVREYPGDARARRDLRIATKFAPYPYRIGSQSIVRACDETLERVGANVRTAPKARLVPSRVQ